MTDTALDMRVQVKRLRPGAVMPFYATAGSAGMDLAACIPEPVEIPPRGRVSIPTGIAVGLPEAHYVGLVFPRSGLASRHGIGLANAVGVIDSDYTGEIICPVQNQSDTAFTVRPGDRIGLVGPNGTGKTPGRG